jgi:alpha-amylase/alpha-mannosidase (GH57 family)
MHVWHLETDTPRRPERASAGEAVELTVGTWPIEPGQNVFASVSVSAHLGRQTEFVRRARWIENVGANSYFAVDLGRFERGDHVRYRVFAEDARGQTVSIKERSFRVGPKIFLALLWHHHQPCYRALAQTSPRGSLLGPWVRLHALRDYCAMAALVAPHRDVRVTINLTPSLLTQLDAYLAGATDRALELTLKPPGELDGDERRELVTRFFDAHLDHQIFANPRYRELYELRAANDSFSDQDLGDLQMWFSLAWFGVELREGSVALPGGREVSVKRFIDQGRNFSRDDIQEVVALQYELMRAVVPIHAELQRAGRIEVSTTPFYHPILPLLIDSDSATLDRDGSWLPRRFQHPEDADAQVALAVADYTRRFGRPPRGMWPAEGAVSQASIPFFAQHGVEWIASDRGVLERSGEYGYRVDDPDVLCRPYRAEEAGESLAIFFRDTALADAIGFEYQHGASGEQAAYDFLTRIKERFARRVSGDDERVVTVALDGENPWGGYDRDGRPFLDALYRMLSSDDEIETVTFGELLDRAKPRELPRVHRLFTGSWADEPGSAPGVDLGTWIGEAEENAAWELLGAARDAISAQGHTPESSPRAYEALYAAEGSDWFWWYGADQESGHDDEFDALFRSHLRAAYEGAGLPAPAELGRAIVPGVTSYSFAGNTPRLDRGSRLAVRVECPGALEWRLDGGPVRLSELVPAGGVMAGFSRHQAVLGPFDGTARALEFRVLCKSQSCKHDTLACSGRVQRVEIG